MLARPAVAPVSHGCGTVVGNEAKDCTTPVRRVHEKPDAPLERGRG